MAKHTARVWERPACSDAVKGTAGVGVFVVEEWIEKVFEVQTVSDRIVKFMVSQRVVIFLSVYAP